MNRIRAPRVILLGVLLLAIVVWLALGRVAIPTEAPAPSTPSVAPAGAITQPPTALPSREEERGRLLYQRYCVFCHGRAADGFGINAPNLRLEVPALADPQRLAGASNQQLADRIARGGSAQGLSAGCPPWTRRLGAGNVHAVVAYLRWLARVAPASSRLP